MKKQLAVLLFVFVVAIGLSGAVSAADWNHGKFIKKHKFKHKIKKHHKFNKFLLFKFKKQKIWNKQSNYQKNKINALVINSPGARVSGVNVGVNAAKIADDHDGAIFDITDQTIYNKQSNKQVNDINALIINSPGAVVSGTNVGVNKLAA